MEEICALLLVAATYSSDIVTLREKLHDHLKWQLQKKKVKAVQSLMAENRKCLEERRVLMENWAGMKIQSPDNENDGFISFKKSLEKAIEEMKKESKQVGEMLHRSKVIKIFFKNKSVYKNIMLKCFLHRSLSLVHH